MKNLLSSLKLTFPVQVAAAVMLTASGVIITATAFLVDTPTFLRNQVTKNSPPS